MFGEEDIIKRRNRSYSIISEGQEGELIVMSRATFKILLMGIESVRNYIVSKLKVKESEVSRILDKQAGQISSAKIHILEKDQVKIATTQDFVKSRSYLNVSRSMYGGQNNISKLGNSISGNNITIRNQDQQNISYAINNSRNMIDNHNYNIRFLKSVPREAVSHFINPTNIVQNISYQKKEESNRQSLPSINLNQQENTQQIQQLSTKGRRDVQQGKRNNSSLEKNYFNNPYSNENYNQNQPYLNINDNDHDNQLYHPAMTQFGKNLKSDQNEQLKTEQSNRKMQTEAARFLSNIKQTDSPVAHQYNTVSPKGQSDLQNTLSPKRNFDQSQSIQNDRGESVGDGTSRVSKNKRDSKFFDNFTRNSVVYLKKYQVNQDKKALFGMGGKRKLENDETIDQKGKQLSEQIQEYINKYEQQMSKQLKNASIVNDENNQPLSPSTKRIYKKPLTQEDHERIQKKKYQEEFEFKANESKIRNFKLNIYKQKS